MKPNPHSGINAAPECKLYLDSLQDCSRWNAGVGAGNTLHDWSGNGNDLTLSNVDPDSYFKSMFPFYNPDGVNDNANKPAPNGIDLGSGDFCFLIWFKGSNTGVTEMLVDNRMDNPSQYGVSCFIHSNERIYFRISNAAKTLDIGIQMIPGVTYKTGNWRLLYIYRSGDTLGINIDNGVQTASTIGVSGISIYNTVQPFSYHCRNTLFVFMGQFGEFLGLTKSLTAEELTWFYKSGRTQRYI